MKEETIEKALNFLNAFCEGKKYSVSMVRKRFGIGAAAVGCAIKLGYIEKQEDGYYTPNKEKIPFSNNHAITLIKEMTNYNKKVNERVRIFPKKQVKRDVKPRKGTGKELAAILYLKKLGYKVLKPINEYKEV